MLVVLSLMLSLKVQQCGNKFGFHQHGTYSLLIVGFSLENEIGAVPLQSAEIFPPPSFNELPASTWHSEGFLVITEAVVSTYLKERSGYMKNYCTGIRLCKCDHVFDLGMGWLVVRIASTLRQNVDPPCVRSLPFYSLFVVLKDGGDTERSNYC